MDFNTTETSIQDGLPVYLITFSRVGKSWRVTNADRDLIFQDNVYTSCAIDVPALLQSGQAQSEQVEFTLPVTAALCQYLDQLAPTSDIGVVIRKAHLAEDAATADLTLPVGLADAPPVWAGEVIGFKRPSLLSRTLVCNTVSLSMARTGLRLAWSRNCPHALFYERGCTLSKEAYAVPLLTLTVVDGLTLSAPELGAFPSGYFSGGFLEWDSSPGVKERIGLEFHAGSTCTTMTTTAFMNLGANFVAYPGCDRTAATCESKFNNLVNFGGINHLQGDSPFDGKPVF